MIDEKEAAAKGRRAYEAGFSRNKAKRHARGAADQRGAFMDAYDAARAGKP